MTAQPDTAFERPVESEADSTRAVRIIRTTDHRLKALEARADVLTVADGSSLAGDEAATPYNSVVDQVLGALGSAIDHLSTVMEVVNARPHGLLPAMALHTLIRSSVEVTATGLWLLGPKGRDERVLRSLRLTLENRRQLSSIILERGETDPRYDEVEIRLEEIRDRRPNITGAPIDGRSLASNTKRLTEIAEYVRQLEVSPLFLWRSMSGVAHNNSSIVMNLVDLEQISDRIDGRAMYRLTSNASMVAAFFVWAIDILEALLDLYDARNIGRA